jgi:hypothetical protein
MYITCKQTPAYVTVSVKGSSILSGINYPEFPMMVLLCPPTYYTNPLQHLQAIQLE